MKTPRKRSAPSQKLRAQAERRLAATPRDVAQLPVADVQKLVEELQVHQIELEMQNDELRRAKLELEQARDRYAGLYDFAPIALLTLDAHSQILEANLAAGHLLGVSRDQLLRQKFTKFIAPESQDVCYLMCREVFSTEGPQRAELELIDAKAKRVVVHLDAVRDATSSRRQCRLSLGDITEQKHAELAVLESQQFAETVLNSLTAHIAIVDQAGRIVSVNQRWRDFAKANGAAPEAVSVGANYLDACAHGARTETDIATIAAGLRAVLRGERPEFYHEYACHAPTRQRWFMMRVTPLRGARPPQVVVAHVDITERKQAEETLAREELLMRTTIDLIPGPFFVKDEQHCFLLANEYCARMMGASAPEELLGKTDEQFYSRAVAAGFRAAEESLLRSGESLVDNEETTPQPDGSSRVLLMTKLPFRDPAGKVIGLVGIGHDIRERKEAESALKAREAQLYSFVQEAPAAIAMFDRNMNYLAASRRWTSDHHVLPEIIGRNHYELHPDLSEQWKAIHRKGLAGETQSCDEDLWLKADGTREWWRWSVNPWLDARGKIGGILILAENITPRKEAEEGFGLFQSLANQSSDTFEVIDPETGRYLDVNANGPAELGCTRAEYLALRVTDIDPHVSMAHWRHFVKEIRASGTRRGEGTHRRKDGTMFPIEFNAKWVHLDRDYIVSVARDITERKRAEARITQLNRVQAILGRVDHAIVHLRDRQSLLEEICRVSVEKGGFQLAWVGLAGPHGVVRPAAQAGATGYLKGIRVTTHDVPEGGGPVGSAIREGRPVVIEDIEVDPRMAPWRARARKFGLRYAAAFPLRVADQVVGAFSVYASQVDFFVEDELALLTQVSEEISFALTAMADQLARKQAEAALRQSEARFKLIFETVPIGIALYTVHADGTFMRTINDALLRLCGITRAQYDEPGLYRRITHPEDLEVQRRFEQQVKAGTLQNFSMEKRYRQPRGRLVWVFFSYQRARHPDGSFEDLTTVVDITDRKHAEEALRRSEHQLSNFFSQAPIGLVLLSASGVILRANEAQLHLLGRSNEEYLGASFLDFAGDPAPGRELLERLAKKGTLRNFPMTQRRKNGQLRHVLVDATSFWNREQFQYSSLFMRDITDRIELEREILQATEREQRRVAQDLHDGLGQLLVGTAYLTSTLHEKLVAKSLPEARPLARILKVIYEAIAQTRNLARGIHPVEPEPNGLMAALETLAVRTKQLFDIDCRFLCRRAVLIQENTVATHLFRIAQEAITNAIKHGKPGRIELSLTETPERIVLAVRDNGAGLPARVKKNPGMGLRIMRYRAGMIGGSLVLQKEAGGGTMVVCTVRVPQKAPAVPRRGRPQKKESL